MIFLWLCIGALGGVVVREITAWWSRPVEVHSMERLLKACIDGWDSGYDDGTEDAVHNVRLWAAGAENLPECCKRNIGFATNYAEGVAADEE